MNKKLLFILLLFLALFSFQIVRAEESETFAADENEVVVGESPSEESSQEVKKEEEEIDSTDVIETVGETGYKVLIEDDAHLLSDEEIEKLRDKMIPLTKYGNVVFKSIEENPYGNADTFVRTYYRTIFPGEINGVLFLIDMDTRTIQIFGDGQVQYTLTSSKNYSITDNVYRYATNGDYYSCAYYAFDQIQTVLEGGKIAEPMRYTSMAVISLVLAFFINFLIVLSQSRIKKAGNHEIVKGCNIDFVVGNANAIKSGTHRVYSPVSDSSSSGGGGGGGGGSSGSSGGHSF